MTKKQFDCVEMKRDIQRRLMSEVAALTSEQRRDRLDRLMERDARFARLWQRTQRRAG